MKPYVTWKQLPPAEQKRRKEIARIKRHMHLSRPKTYASSPTSNRKGRPPSRDQFGFDKI